MEHNGDMPPSTLCRQGCGFYGNANFEGMCSKCYKDVLKRRSQSATPTSAPVSGRVSPTVSLNEPSLVPAATPSSVETAMPTVPIATPSSTNPIEDASSSSTDVPMSASPTVESDGNDSGKDDKKKPKKSRCHTCKKKVGLTGFECRCGGLYCGLHRYSDKHSCSFNYRELGQEQIRKNNPVVVGEKIQKI